MAGAIVQSQYAVDDSGTTATTISATLTGVAAGNLIAAHVGFGTGGSGGTCTVSDGTSYATAAALTEDVGNGQWGAVFYLKNAGSGSHTVTATFGGACPFRKIRAIEVSGLDTTSPLDQGTGQAQNPSPGTGTDAVTSGNMTATTNANDFIMGFSQDTSEVDPGTGTMTAGTNFTISGTNIILSLESRNVSATGAYAATFTQSVANTRVTHAVAFIQAAVVATPIPLMGQACL